MRSGLRAESRARVGWRVCDVEFVCVWRAECGAGFAALVGLLLCGRIGEGPCCRVGWRLEFFCAEDAEIFAMGADFQHQRDAEFYPLEIQDADGMNSAGEVRCSVQCDRFVKSAVVDYKVSIDIKHRSIVGSQLPPVIARFANPE